MVKLEMHTDFQTLRTTTKIGFLGTVENSVSTVLQYSTLHYWCRVMMHIYMYICPWRVRGNT